jgi:hypothetical protein
LEIGDTAGLETRATPRRGLTGNFALKNNLSQTAMQTLRVACAAVKAGDLIILALSLLPAFPTKGGHKRGEQD